MDPGWSHVGCQPYETIRSAANNSLITTHPSAVSNQRQPGRRQARPPSQQLTPRLSVVRLGPLQPGLATSHLPSFMHQQSELHWDQPGAMFGQPLARLRVIPWEDTEWRKGNRLLIPGCWRDSKFINLSHFYQKPHNHAVLWLRTLGPK